MITKAQATDLATTYYKGLPSRIEAALVSNASAGVVGVAISYVGVPRALADRVITGLQATGWTVADDQVNFVLTIT